jgi:hypothetical protein
MVPSRGRRRGRGRERAQLGQPEKERRGVLGWVWPSVKGEEVLGLGLRPA